MTRALELARSVALGEGVAKALLGLGVIIRRSMDRRDTAHEALLSALQQDFSDQDADLRARVHLNLTMVYTLRGDRQQAEEAIRQASDEIPQTGNPLLEAWLWKYRGFVALLSNRETASERFIQAASRFAEASNAQEAEVCRLLAAFWKGDLVAQWLQALLTIARRSGGVSPDVIEYAEASLRDLDVLLETAVPAEVEAAAASHTVRKATQAAIALEDAVGVAVRTTLPASTMSFLKWLEERFDPRSPLAATTDWRFHERIGKAIDESRRLVEKGDFAGARRVIRDLPDSPADLKELQTMHEILARLAADPGDAGWQRDLAVSHGTLGDVLVAQGDLSGAVAHHQASLAIGERLAAQDPGNAVWQHDLAVSHDRLGDARRAQGDLSGALEAYRATHEILARLAAADPGNAEWQRALWVSCWRMADIAERTGRRDAVEWWRKAYETLTGMKQRGMHISPEDEGFLEQMRAKLEQMP